MVESYNKQRFGERVHLMRRRRGMTLKALAQQAGTSYATVSKLEHGEKPQLSLDVAARIAAVLAVSLDWLIGQQLPEPDDDEELLQAVA